MSARGFEPRGVIEAEHYEATRRRLAATAAVRSMARELPEELPAEMVRNGRPTFKGMLIANEEYAKRTDDAGPRHIGAVAEALLRLHAARRWRVERDPQTGGWYATDGEAESVGHGSSNEAKDAAEDQAGLPRGTLAWKHTGDPAERFDAELAL